MTDQLSDLAARIDMLRADMAALPTPAADPSPPAAPAPAPALTSGRDAYGYAPPFDPAEVAAKVPPRPVTGSGHQAGDYLEPAEPFAPPAGVEVPADLVAALAEYDARRAAWVAAVDAVEDFRDDARESRAKRDAAISAAARAEVQGKSRPKIPNATSETDEETEVRILTAVVNARRGEATAAARKADRLTMTYAPQWAAEAVERFGPALDKATAAVQAAYEAAEAAEAVLGQAAHWRSLALAEDLKRAGVNVSEHRRARMMSDLLDASKPWQYASAEGHQRNPVALLHQVHAALGTLRQCDPGVVPAADTLNMPGSDAAYVEVWRAMYDAATEERKQRFRNRHTGGRLLRHEREH
ncbi:hypothetical protein AB0873_16685 [Micromonospora sp. NPDC047707]|uniref:hypothetical protein n=1 Tax=Micromonospora sp. NPDC047707 TaxID=3154498 RepID=UPI0034538BB3